MWTSAVGSGVAVVVAGVVAVGRRRKESSGVMLVGTVAPVCTVAAATTA
jgi:hypothetical protein